MKDEQFSGRNDGQLNINIPPLPGETREPAEELPDGLRDLSEQGRLTPKEETEQSVPDSSTGLNVPPVRGSLSSYEYTNISQRKKIRGVYRYNLILLGFRIAAVAIFTLLCGVLENASLIGVPFISDLIAEHRLWYILADCGGLFACALLAIPQIGHGARSVFAGDPVPECLSTVTLLFSVIHSVISTATAPADALPTYYNFAGTFALLCVLIFTYVNTKRESRTFDIVASKNKKYVLTPRTTGDFAIRSDMGTATRMSIKKTQKYHVERTAFVNGYFANTNVSPDLRAPVSLVSILTFAVAILVFALKLNRGAGGFDAFSAFCLTFFAGIPMSLYFNYSVPFSRATKKSSAWKCAIIGEQSLIDYDGAQYFAVDDSVIYPASKLEVRTLGTYGDATVTDVLNYAWAAFGHVGGPTADYLNALLSDPIKIDWKTEYIGSGFGYLKVRANGTEVLVATLDALSAFDMADGVNRDLHTAEGEHVMYIFANGKPVGHFGVIYHADREAVSVLLKLMSSSNRYFTVRSMEPCITPEMLKQSICPGMKYTIDCAFDESAAHPIGAVSDSMDAGLVSKGASPLALFRVLPLCHSVFRARRINTVLQWIGTLGAFFAMTYFAFASAPFALTSAFVVAYQFALILLTDPVSRLTIRLRRPKKDEI